MEDTKEPKIRILGEAGRKNKPKKHLRRLEKENEITPIRLLLSETKKQKKNMKSPEQKQAGRDPTRRPSLPSRWSLFPR